MLRRHLVSMSANWTQTVSASAVCGRSMRLPGGAAWATPSSGVSSSLLRRDASQGP